MLVKEEPDRFYLFYQERIRITFIFMAYTVLKPLNIDDAARAHAKELRAYAHERRMSLTDARTQLISGQPMKNAEKLTMQVPIGYHIAYSIEQRSEGWFQRISVFHATPRIEPAPTVVARILEELFDIHAKKKAVGGRGGSVLDEALEVEPQNLANGCIAISLLYRYTWPGHEAPTK